MLFTEYVKIREEKFGAVVFETLKEKVFVTNETGKDVLSLLGDGRTVEEIINLLANAHDLKPLDIKEDVLSFISQLKDNGIIAKSKEHRV